jgi:hypothetical protein
MIKNSFCEHVVVLPEAAGIIFGGGFPRRDDIAAAQSAQRAIFYVQRELEKSVEGRNFAIALCDRGTVDGGAYWTGASDLWSSVDTTLATQLARYSAVIHMRVPTESSGYNHQNPLRTESAEEAARIDSRIAQLWAGHPSYVSVNPEHTFLDKAAKVLSVLRLQIPECCRVHGPFVQRLSQ